MLIIDTRRGKRMERHTGGWVDRWMEGWMAGWTDRQTQDGWQTDKQMDGHIQTDRLTADPLLYVHWTNWFNVVAQVVTACADSVIAVWMLDTGQRVRKVCTCSTSRPTWSCSKARIHIDNHNNGLRDTFIELMKEVQGSILFHSVWHPVSFLSALIYVWLVCMTSSLFLFVSILSCWLYPTFPFNEIHCSPVHFSMLVVENKVSISVTLHIVSFMHVGCCNINISWLHYLLIIDHHKSWDARLVGSNAWSSQQFKEVLILSNWIAFLWGKTIQCLLIHMRPAWVFL